MMKKIYFLYAGLFAAVLSGCSHSLELKPEKITNLYEPIYKFNTMDSTAQSEFIAKDSLELSVFFKVLGKDSLTRQSVKEWSDSKAVRVFTPAVDSVFHDLRPVENTLGLILENFTTNKFPLPHKSYIAAVWGLPKSMVFCDSSLIIALNHYLGSEYAGYSAWPTYMRLQKTPKRLAYDLVEALAANEYPYKRTPSSTVLSRIIYEGALTLAKVRIVPQGTLSGALGYTNEELQWLSDHESDLWRTLVGKNLLYSTSEDVASKLVDPAPATPLLSPYSPGRVGRYLGYCILTSYLENNAVVSLPDLLKPEFYDNPSILVESAYE